MAVRYFLRKQFRVCVGIPLVGTFALFLMACGGGGSQGSPPPPPAVAVIAFPTNTDSADSANLANNIWTIKADGSSATQLTNYHGDDDVTAQALEPFWSPDGTKIVYVSDGALDGSNTLGTYYYFWVMNADGSGKTPLNNVGPADYTVVGNSADWSHDGTKLAVTANQLDIYIMNADGSNPTLVFGPALGAVWSPDDTKLALASANNIWTVNTDGTGATQLTNLSTTGALAANAPVWSPDGTKLAFNVSDLHSGGFTIQTVNADGSNLQSHTGSSYFFSGMIGRVVNWSPDGTQLTFNSTAALSGNGPDGNALNIWVMNADGSGARPVTQYTANGVAVFVPAWSPDGKKIAFLSNAALDGSNAPSASTWCLWTVNADGSGVAPLTALATGSGWNTYWLQPDWKP